MLSWAGRLGADLDRVNVNGGAIALGHPMCANLRTADHHRAARAVSGPARSWP
ncbi:hypothetical protein [Micromonospora sp. b486]|uniref:hypothetical protein n=1 Tax=Micromonospora sp. b486 TaxID=3053986 RepID=UPI00259CB554|nr:hypothetical protein [Micromonospora sp. b486]MDM4784433.1 hypothetical protein [Micromonospora sp. b486]